MLQIVKYKKYSFALSALLVVVSIFILSTYGLKPGIDFTGGSLLEVKYSDGRPDIAEIQNRLASLDLGTVQVQPSDELKMILRMRFLNEAEHQQVLTALRTNVDELVENNVSEIDIEDGGEAGVIELNLDDKITEAEVPNVLEERFETIGPTISAQLRKRAVSAAIAVVLAIILYIGYAFRKVSKPVQSWKYGIAAIIALVHDVLIAMAIFALLGHFRGVEIDIPFVVALLTILGYSVNDTIVVFDRIRETLIRRGSEGFGESVNIGVNQTISRSINTSLTTLLVLLSLFLFGGASIHYFSLTLIIGVVVGTYSSIFLASPLLVFWEDLKSRRAK